jgi:uncharacterized protein (DUF885 family)
MRNLGIVIFSVGLCLQLPGALAADPAATSEVRKIFDDYWEGVLRESPTYATLLGDRRYNGKLEDLSASGIQRRRTSRAELLRRLEAVDASALDERDRTSRAVLLFRLRNAVRCDRVMRDLPLEFGPFVLPTPVTQFFGAQLWLPEVTNATSFRTVRDYEDYLERLDAVPAYLEQLTAQLRTGLSAGWVPARIAVRNAPSQFDAIADSDPVRNPMFAPFTRFAEEIPDAARVRLRAAGERAIRERVAPSFANLRAFLIREYLPAGRDDIAAQAQPGGAEFYAAALESHTTTSISAKEIHELGLREVARIEAEQLAIQQRAGFATRKDFLQYLQTDPKFFFDSAEAMLAAYRDIAKRIDPELPALFRELPKLPYGIRAMPKEQGDNAEYYMEGAADGSRAGYFMANTNNLRRTPRWQMTDLVLHEAVPGHHLQIARAQEIGELPAFRRHTWFTAYGEGWALYAEALGDRIGVLQDPLDKYGQLVAEAWRATRLVVDTGIHAFGWSRDRALQYMRDHTAGTELQVVAEVDRYIVWPGQATAYKVGQLRIAALRDRAREALGERFDLREFHNAVLDGGTVPLPVLEEQIDRWIAAVKARKP